MADPRRVCVSACAYAGALSAALSHKTFGYADTFTVFEAMKQRASSSLLRALKRAEIVVAEAHVEELKAQEAKAAAQVRGRVNSTRKRLLKPHLQASLHLTQYRDVWPGMPPYRTQADGDKGTQAAQLLQSATDGDSDDALNGATDAAALNGQKDDQDKRQGSPAADSVHGEGIGAAAAPAAPRARFSKVQTGLIKAEIQRAQHEKSRKVVADLMKIPELQGVCDTHTHTHTRNARTLHYSLCIQL